jgi:hypothetical protein
MESLRLISLIPEGCLLSVAINIDYAGIYLLAALAFDLASNGFRCLCNVRNSVVSSSFRLLLEIHNTRLTKPMIALGGFSSSHHIIDIDFRAMLYHNCSAHDSSSVGDYF